MSRVYVQSAGGGGRVFAAIGVEYPAGSLCSCSNGSKTLKAKNSSGRWVFPVSAPGRWTVIAESGDDRAEQSFEISAEGQFEKALLGFHHYLFREGQGLGTAADGSSYSIEFGALNHSVSPAGIVWSDKKDTGNAFYFSPKLDCSKYSKLFIELQHSEQAAAQYTSSFGVGVNVTTGANQANGWTAHTEGIWTLSRAVYEVPLENVNDLLYVKFVSYANTGTIYNIWLEE